MPPKNKATSKSTKKGKAPTKMMATPSPGQSDSEWTSGGEGEEVSVKDLLSNMTSMIAALHTRMDTMEAGGKKRKVAFHGGTPASHVTATGPVLRPPPGLPSPPTRP